MLHIDTIDIILIASCFVVATVSLLTALRPFRRVATYQDSASEPLLPSPEGSDTACASAYPKVSVIVYAHTDFERLEDYLHELCNQDYPDFEVVVVCDANSEAATELAEKYEDLTNVHVTFVPPGSHNLSRRKLANTIGVKAAKGDIVVTTMSNATIHDNSWLRALVAPMLGHGKPGVSLGYARYDISELHGISRYYREFDALLDATNWLSSAIRNRPWRGEAANMAFRKDLFFKCKGYSKSINLHAGYDDLFVCDLVAFTEAIPALSPESMITIHWGDAASRTWTDRKDRHDFTRRWLPRYPRISSGWISGSQWLTLSLAAATALTGLPSLLPAAAALIILLIFWGIEIAAYRKTAGRLGATRLWWAVPLFLLWHPVGNAIFRMKHRSTRFKNYTWQRHRR